MSADKTECDPPGTTRGQGQSSGKYRHEFGYVFLASAVFAIALLRAGVARPFHSGGVGDCGGCHRLHSANNGAAPAVEEGSGAPLASGSLLAGRDPSSTCLRCHSRPGDSGSVLTQDGSARTPGGDFSWLKRSFQWATDGEMHSSPGASHGHSIVASEYGLTSDPGRPAAPGGTYPAASLSCISCHDPHGRISGPARNGGPISTSGSYGDTPPDGTVAGNYRLLGGTGYEGAAGSAEPFHAPAPVAVMNRDDWRETETNHPDYGSGMSEWCANCHAGILSGGTGGVRSHPAGNDVKLDREIVASYNGYVKTGDLSGARMTAYLALVPFERGTADPSKLNSSRTEGPDEHSNVMCLTCHRAHASAFPAAGRWDFRATFIARSYPDDREAYYGRDIVSQFGQYQRSFCNKCHPRD